MAQPPNHDGARESTGHWTHVPASTVTTPIVVESPYVELALEHPDLPATRMGGAFWPAAVPYEFDGEHRVFYWRDELDAGTPEPTADAVLADARGWVATPDTLIPGQKRGQEFVGLAADTDAGGHEVVVDATIAGDSTSTHVDGYQPPRIVIREQTADSVTVAGNGHITRVSAGNSEQIELPAQTVTLLDSPTNPASEVNHDVGDRVETTPVLCARHPGTRRLYHPAPGSDYLLFPSFGIDLPTDSGRVPGDPDSVERDLDAIADSLGAALSGRPYPERVVWEAFVYAAFDPDRAGAVELTQFENGLLAVHDPPASMTGN